MARRVDQDREAALRDVVLAEQAIRRAQDELDKRVRIARRLGVTWRRIGEELGTSRQAAYDRFKGIGVDRQLRP